MRPVTSPSRSQALQRAFEDITNAAAKVTVSTRDGAALDATDLPIAVKAGGLDLVVLTAAEYRSLVASRAERAVTLPKAILRSRAVIKPRPSTVERDPEVASFLREHQKRGGTVRFAHSACAERFGLDRTPSPSRINRLFHKIRQGA